MSISSIASLCEDAANNHQCLQHPPELIALYEHLADEDFKIIVEIGSAYGGHLWLLHQIWPAARLISVSMPDSIITEAKCELITGNSHEGSVFRALRTLLDGENIDYLFLDGDHSTIGVGQDFQMYSELVRLDGFIGFHDTCWPWGDYVSAYWEDIKQKYRHQEFHLGGQGVGIIQI